MPQDNAEDADYKIDHIIGASKTIDDDNNDEELGWILQQLSSEPWDIRLSRSMISHGQWEARSWERAYLRRLAGRRLLGS